MQAIVLAGGLGMRLRSVVADLPKPMAPVAGRPFLAWILDRLAQAAFERVVLAVGYRHEVIERHFGHAWRGVQLHYSVEVAPLGTGGALRLAAGHVGRWPVFVLNGDTFLDLDYGAMLKAHLRGQERMSLAVCHVADASRYGALDLYDRHVRGFLEKGRSGPGVINAGTYLLSQGVLERIPHGVPFSFEQQLLVPEVGDIRPAAYQTDGVFIDIGVPEDYERAQQLFAPGGRRGTMTPPQARKALFLDRDGVINVDRHHVHRVEDFEFLPGIFELCAAAAARGYLLVVVTNQAGIGRGLYTEADFQRLTAWMLDALRRRGIEIARVYHCPYHPTAGIGEYRRESFDRKPNPGMLLKARDDLGLDLSRSGFIGDKDSDMEAGRRAGVGTLIRLAGPGTSPSGAADVCEIDSLLAAATALERSSKDDLRFSARR